MRTQRQLKTLKGPVGGDKGDINDASKTREEDSEHT